MSDVNYGMIPQSGLYPGTGLEALIDYDGAIEGVYGMAEPDPVQQSLARYSGCMETVEVFAVEIDEGGIWDDAEAARAIMTDRDWLSSATRVADVALNLAHPSSVSQADIETMKRHTSEAHGSLEDLYGKVGAARVRDLLGLE